MMAYRISLECGDTSSLRSKKTIDGYTHDWEVWIKGADNAPIHHYIEKVVFNLHQTFQKPKRVIKEPPYRLKETGYAGFDIPIHVYLKNNKSEPKRFDILYNLNLDTTTPTISHRSIHNEVIVNPSEEFRKKLLKGGATPTSVDGPPTAAVLEKSEGKVLAMVGKPKLSGNSEMKKHRTTEPKSSNQFNDLFGPPIKTVKLTQEIKKTMDHKPSNSKGSSVQEKFDKIDKIIKVKHSPHKDSSKKDKTLDERKRDKDCNNPMVIVVKENEKISKDKSKRLSRSPLENKVGHQNLDKKPSSPVVVKRPSSPPLTSSSSSSKSLKEKESKKESDKDKEKEKSKESLKSTSSSTTTSDEVLLTKAEKESNKSERKKEKKRHKEDRDKEKRDKHRDRDKSKDKEAAVTKSNNEKKIEKDKLESSSSSSKSIKDEKNKSSPKNFKENSDNSKTRDEKIINKIEKLEKNEIKEKSKEYKSEKLDKSKHKHKKKDKKEKRDDNNSKEKGEKKEKREKSSSSSSSKSEVLVTNNHIITSIVSREKDSSDSSGDEEIINVKKETLQAATVPPPPPPSSSQVLQVPAPPPPPPAPVNNNNNNSFKKDKSEKKRDRSRSRREEKESKKRKRKSESKGGLVEEDQTLSLCKKSKDRDHSTSPLVEPVSSSQSPIAAAAAAAATTNSADLLHSNKIKQPIIVESTKTINNAKTKITTKTTINDSEQVAPDSTNSTLIIDADEPLVFSEDYVLQLKQLQQKIMTLQDNQELQRVVQVIAETGQYEITKKTFDFDLCALDRRTVQRLQQFFAAS